MLGLENPLHIVIVLIVVLMVFGAKRLPEMGKSLGSGLRGFKDSLSGEDHVSQLPAEHAPQRLDELTTSSEHTPVQPAA